MRVAIVPADGLLVVSPETAAVVSAAAAAGAARTRCRSRGGGGDAHRHREHPRRRQRRRRLVRLLQRRLHALLLLGASLAPAACVVPADESTP